MRRAVEKASQEKASQEKARQARQVKRARQVERARLEWDKGIRQIGAILHAKAVSATVVKPFGFATGDWEGSRCGIRTRITLQNPVAQVVGAILWGHGPFATPGQGGCSLGMHGSPPKRREKKARRSAAGRPSRRFGPPRRSWGLTHCVKSRLRRELYHPQRSSETLRLACKIAPICLIPLLQSAPGRLAGRITRDHQRTGGGQLGCRCPVSEQVRQLPD